LFVVMSKELLYLWRRRERTKNELNHFETSLYRTIDLKSFPTIFEDTNHNTSYGS
jgi:hypothetical protein